MKVLGYFGFTNSCFTRRFSFFINLFCIKTDAMGVVSVVGLCINENLFLLYFAYEKLNVLCT